MKQNNNSYRHKGRAVFLAAIMVLSVVAVGFAGFSGIAAAQVTDSGEPTNVTVGPDSTEQIISGINTDEDGDLNISVDALADAGANLTAATATEDGTSDALGSVDFNSDTNNITAEVTENGEGPFNILLSDIDMSEVTGPESGLTYTVEDDAGDTATTDAFSLVSAEGVTMEPVTDSSEVVFTVDHETAGTAAETVSVFVADADENEIDSEEVTASGGDATGVLVDLDSVEEDDELTVHVVAESDDDPSFTASLTNFQIQETITFELVEADQELSEWDGALLWEGQVVEVDLPGVSAGTQVDVREVTSTSNGNPSDTRQARTVTVTGSNTIVVDTDRLRGEGDYVLRSGGNWWHGSSFESSLNSDDTAVAELLEQDLTVAFDEDSVDNTETVDVDVESVRSSFTLEITGELDGSTIDHDTLEEIFGDNDGFEVVDEDDDIVAVDAADGESFEADFDDQDGGEYDFEFDVADTTASASDSITVNDVGDAELSVEDVSQEQGDIAEIVVGATATDSGYLIIGDEDDVNYQLNVSIDSFGDNDEITIYFNTYAAGNSSFGDVVWVDDDEDEDAVISVDDETADIDGILDTGDYDLAVSHESFAAALDDEDDIAALFVEERGTYDSGIWTASDDNADDIIGEDEADRVGAIADAIGNDLVTPSDAVAHDDYAIYQLEADGLQGLFQYAENQTGAETPGDQFVELVTNASLSSENDADSILDMQIRETRDSVGPNAPRRTINVSDLLETDEFEVVHDDDAEIGEEEGYYVLLSTDDMVFENGDQLDDEADYEFEVRFEIRDERLLIDDADDVDDVSDYYESLENGHDVVERAGEFDVSDEDLIEVEAIDEARISGETNIAPGSEVRIRTSGTGDARFTKSISEIVVDSDGTFAAEFDFSDRNVGDTFEASLRGASIDPRPTADGEVVESEPEEDDADDVDDVDDDDVDDADDVDDTTDDDVDDVDDATDDDADDADDTTDDETPGFGALVALMALLGAALLAARRQN